MATLYVEDIPDDRYEALYELAKRNQRSISEEILVLLQENVPTEKEIEARRQAIRWLEKLTFTSNSTTPMPSSLDMIREDRER
jgi:plasmid stability protein